MIVPLDRPGPPLDEEFPNLKSDRIVRLIPLSLILLLPTMQGCRAPLPTPPRLEADARRLEPSPPAPIAIGTSATSSGASAIVSSPIRIRPEDSVGYDTLPTTVTQLFDRTPTPLSLADAVGLTLANERGLKIQGYDLRIAQYEVPVAKGIYDLTMSTGYLFRRIEEQISPAGFVGQSADSQRVRDGYVRLGQLLPTGATLTLAYEAMRRTNLFTAFDDAFNRTLETDVRYLQRATVGVRQPLLRGFGPGVTNAGIRIARAEEAGAAADFQTNLEATLAGAIATYWELIGAIEIYRVRVVSYAAARDLLRVNTARYEAGTLRQSDVLQARAAAESRRAELIRARRNVRDIEDDLKRRIFLQSGGPQWETQIRPSQPIAWREIAADQEDAIRTALDARSELRRALAEIDKSRIESQVTDNALLPQLNLIGEISSNGLDSNFDRSWDTATDGKYTSYDVGAELIYPLQNRAARYRRKQAQARGLRANEALEQLRDRITLEVRQAVRGLSSARQRIDATMSTVVSQEENLRSQTRLYEAGVATAFEVLEFQDDLAEAQSQHIAAVIEYNIAALALERARGTLLATYGVTLVDADGPSKGPDSLFPVGWN
jgi:outer membrane protein TolC